jgi:hypothetical protein
MAAPGVDGSVVRVRQGAGVRVGAALLNLHNIFSSWQPKSGVMPHPGLQRFSAVWGAWTVSVFAWQMGPPVGLAAWYRSSDALCGWWVHLMGALGVELLAWVLGPFEAMVVG